MIECPNCGVINNDNSSYCNNCGYKLNNKTMNVINTNKEKPEIKILARRTQASKTIGIILIIISLFVLWPLMIVGFILLIPASTNNSLLTNLIEADNTNKKIILYALNGTKTVLDAKDIDDISINANGMVKVTLSDGKKTKLGFGQKYEIINTLNYINDIKDGYEYV